MLTQRMAKNANAILAADVLDPESSFLLQRDGETFRQTTNALAERGRRPARRARARPGNPGEAARARPPVSMNSARRLPASSRTSRSCSARSRPLGFSCATRPGSSPRPPSSRPRTTSSLRGQRWLYLLLGMLGIAAIVDGRVLDACVPRRQRAPRLRGATPGRSRRPPGGRRGAREQAESGSDSASDERDDRGRRRRSHRARNGDRGHHRRHRRLGELHRRGAARAGRAHQLGRRTGEYRDRARARHLDAAARCGRNSIAPDPGSEFVGAAHGARDQRRLGECFALGRRRAPVARRRGRRAPRRYTTRSPA